ncbi:MAG: hypothetical protein ACE5RN_03175 [Nitrosopumilaceae archaeon]
MKAFKKDSDDIFLRGTIIAIFTTIPSISAFFIAWYIVNDLILAAIIATIVHVFSMAISFKISKKLFLKK